MDLTSYINDVVFLHTKKIVPKGTTSYMARKGHATSFVDDEDDMFVFVLHFSLWGT
jgi:hypothetical protein